MSLIGKVINNQYKIIEKTAEGGMSNIYLARDLTSDDKPIAIKILKSTATSSRIEDIIRFRSEADILTQLDHPNIVKIYGIGEILELHYLSMEYIEGRSLSEIISEGTIPLDEVINFFHQLCIALNYIHGNEIIHRDLKPGNIMVCRGRIKLIDFGLAQIKDFSKLDNSATITGTFGYISPEQSGIIRRTVDERSDLYSLGIIIYQLLAGRLPFQGTSVSSIMHQHIAKTPEPLSEHNSIIPGILDRIVLKLLEKDPDNRYQSARGLLNDLEKFQNGQDDFLLGLNDRFTKLNYRTRIIGRDEELRKIKQLISRSQKGNGGICLISGEAGIGKTRIVEELRDYIYSAGGLLIDGKCFSQENTIPYGPLKDALNLYFKHYENYSDKKKKAISGKIKEEFNNLGEIIIKLNPVTKGILGECPPLAALEPENESKRFHMVAGQFFHRLSDLEGTLVILLDDLQWSDDGTLNLLNELLDDISNHPLIIIGTCRDNEITGEHSLHKLLKKINDNNIACEQIHLDALSPEILNIFISNLLSEPAANTKEISKFIHTKSRGNLFFTIEILKQLIEEKVIFYKDNHWCVDKSELKEIEISPSIIDIILKRIRLLDEEEKNILSYASVTGKKFDFEILFRLSGLEMSEIVRIVDKAIYLQLLEVDPLESEKILFVHDKIRETFYESIDKNEKKKIHLAAAEALEEINIKKIDEVVFDLAHHFIEAENKEKSIQYALPAGIKAKEKYANEDAIKYIQKTIDLLEESHLKSGKLWIECKELLGEIYITIGKYGNAIEFFNEILPLTGDNIKKSKIYKQISDAYYRRGNWKKCEEHAARGLSLLGEKLPLSRFKVGAAILKELIIHVLHNIFPFLFIRASENQYSKRYRPIVAFYESLSMVYALNDPVKFIRVVLRFLNLCEHHIGPSRELAKSLTAYAGICMAIPLFKRARKYNEKGLTLYTKLHYEWGKAKNFELIGYYHEWKGEYTKSREYFTMSYDIFSRLGDIKEMGMALNGLEHCSFFVSDYENAKAANDEYSEIANSTLDDYAISTADMYYARYYRETGDIEKAYEYAWKANSLSLERQIWFNYCISFLTLGSIAVETGEIEDAVIYLEESKKLNEKYYFLTQYSAPVYYYLALAYLEDYVNKEQKLTPKERKVYLNKIKKACSKAIKKTRKWATHSGCAFRVTGNYFALTGSNRKAEKYFVLSVDQFKKTGRRFELARTYYDYGLFLLFRLNDIKNSKKYFEAAYQIFNAIGSKLYIEKLKNNLGVNEDSIDSTSMISFIDKERIFSINKLGRKIQGISNIEELFNEVIATVTVQLGAQRGYLFMVNEESKELEMKASKCISASDTLEYSKHIVEEVFSKGQNIITADAGKEDQYLSYNSIVSSNLKSILCVPIKSREKNIGVCYVDNPLSSGVFTEKNGDLLVEFFTRISSQIENLSPKETKTPRGFYKQDYVTDSAVDKMKSAIEYIEKNYTSDISREGLAALLDINPDNLGRIFKKYTGRKISDYINELRIKDSAKRLKNSDDNIVDIAFSAGFESLSTFNRVFSKIMKTTPTKYRNDN